MKLLVKMAGGFLLIVLGASCFAQCSVRCQAAFSFVVSHEDKNLSGKVAKEPLGGIARFGVNSRAHPEAVKRGFYTMGREKALRYAQDLFYRDYWTAIHGDDITSERLAFKLADLAYNLGPIRATVLLQKALKDIGEPDYDRKGYFGDSTLSAIHVSNSDQLTVALEEQAYDYYVRLSMKLHISARWRKTFWTNRLREEAQDWLPSITQLPKSAFGSSGLNLLVQN